MVEGSRLLTCRGAIPIVGSSPTLSATFRGIYETGNVCMLEQDWGLNTHEEGWLE